MARIVRRRATQAARTANLDPERLAATTDADIERQMAEDSEEPGSYHDTWCPSVLQLGQGLNLTQAEIAKLLGVINAVRRFDKEHFAFAVSL